VRKKPQTFTRNKEYARVLQRETIERCLRHKLGRLAYFGLPSSSLNDVKAWQDIVESFVAVERGEEGKEWELQHDLQLEAFRAQLFTRIILMRGDIDSVILKGKDISNNILHYPFDVISLDYSGGLFYKDRKGTFLRLRAISAAIAAQGKKHADFVLLISCNLSAIDQGEVKNTIENIRTDLTRYGASADQVINSYQKHQRNEVRLKLYVPYLVNQAAAKNHYYCETQQVVFYSGNQDVSMMMFRFCLKFDARTESLRSPKERLSQIINKPMIQIENGLPMETNLQLPKLALLEESRKANA